MATDAIFVPASDRSAEVSSRQSNCRTRFLQWHGGPALYLRLHRFFSNLLSGRHVARAASQPDPPRPWRNLHPMDAAIHRCRLPSSPLAASNGIVPSAPSPSAFRRS